MPRAGDRSSASAKSTAYAWTSPFSKKCSQYRGISWGGRLPKVKIHVNALAVLAQLHYSVSF